MQKFPSNEISQEAQAAKEAGNQLFLQKNYQAALECYKKALLLSPNFKEAWLNQGKCYQLLNDHIKALAAFDEAIELDKCYAKAIASKIEILVALENKYLSILNTIDDYQTSGGTHADIIQKRDHYAGLIVKETLGPGASLNPNKLFREAQQYKTQGQLDKAKQYVNAVVILQPNHQEATALQMQLLQDASVSNVSMFKQPKNAQKPQNTTNFTAKHYFYVKQGHLSCWQYDATIPASHDFGFYTEKFYNCAIMILRSQDKTKIVTLHIDPAVILADVKSMIAWAGEDCHKICYVKRSKDAEETLTDLFESEAFLQDSFTIKWIEPLKIKGTIVMDQDNPHIPEFEASVIWVDKDGDFSTKYYEEPLITDDDEYIKDCYSKFQSNTAGTFANKAGCNMGEVMQALQLVDPNLEGRKQMLYDLTIKGDYGNVRSLIDTGFNINDKILGYTLLAFAATEGHLKLLNLFISRGANIDEPIEITHQGRVVRGATPLLLAAGRGHAPIVKRLLERGADIGYLTEAGAGIWQMAAVSNNPEIIELISTYQKPVSKFSMSSGH